MGEAISSVDEPVSLGLPQKNFTLQEPSHTSERAEWVYLCGGESLWSLHSVWHVGGLLAELPVSREHRAIYLT